MEVKQKGFISAFLSFGYFKKDTLMKEEHAVDFEKVNLINHWRGVEELLKAHDWPFTKHDFDLYLKQSKSFGYVALKYSRVIGFFIGHSFSNIAYLSMIIIDKDERNNTSVIRRLWALVRSDVNALRLDCFVAHCTKMSRPLLEFYGFSREREFNYMIRDVSDDFQFDESSELDFSIIDNEHLNDLLDLDASVFGEPRVEWVSSLLSQQSTKFYGYFQQGELISSVCVRTRSKNSICFDACCADHIDHLSGLLCYLTAKYQTEKIECFPKLDSDLENQLFEYGFYVPDEFKDKGPLVELRKGMPYKLGTSKIMRTMSWI